MLGVEFIRSGDVHGTCFWHIEMMASIMVECWATVPCVNALWAPRCTIEGRRVYDCSCAGRSEWVCIPVIFCAM